MKVDYLCIHLKTSIIPSRTKHEFFDSFGSHTQLLQLLIYGGDSHIFFFYVMSLSSSYLLYSYYKMSRLINNPRPEYSEDSSDQTKIDNCQQSCFFFLQIQRILLTLYIGHRFSIKRGWLKYPFFQYFPIKGSNHFIDMSVL